MFNRKKDQQNEPVNPEVVEETTETAAQPETLDDELEELDAELEELEAELEEAEVPEEIIDPLVAELAQAKENYLRLAAEYENYRKRTAREKEALSADVKASTVSKLLPILDNIDLALTFDGADENTMRRGVEMIKQQALTIFEALGITPFCEPGDVFDPNLHNAIGMVASEEYESGQITLVIQKGYALGDRIIRPAMVQIAE